MRRYGYRPSAVIQKGDRVTIYELKVNIATNIGRTILWPKGTVEWVSTGIGNYGLGSIVEGVASVSWDNGYGSSQHKIDTLKKI